MNSLEMVRLIDLMNRSQGRPDIAVALIDGPVAGGLSALTSNIYELPGKLKGICARTDTFACMHGTLVAGILFARRGSGAPAICPGCTLLLRPIFADARDQIPSATAEDLAAAIIDSIEGGARIINVSSALVQLSSRFASELEKALDYSARRDCIVVAAAGNQGVVGSSVILSHQSVIPVVSCDANARPLNGSNLGASIGRRGLRAPGENIVSLGSDGTLQRFSGTSAAAPFVTGTIALLWSEFPQARACDIKLAATGRRRNALVPPLLDAWRAYQTLASFHPRKEL